MVMVADRDVLGEEGAAAHLDQFAYRECSVMTDEHPIADQQPTTSGDRYRRTVVDFAVVSDHDLASGFETPTHPATELDVRTPVDLPTRSGEYTPYETDPVSKPIGNTRASQRSGHRGNITQATNRRSRPSMGRRRQICKGWIHVPGSLPSPPIPRVRDRQDP